MYVNLGETCESTKPRVLKTNVAHSALYFNGFYVDIIIQFMHFMRTGHLEQLM